LKSCISSGYAWVFSCAILTTSHKLSKKFGKPLTPLEEKTYNFGSDDEDNCQDAVETGTLSAKMTVF
jgi:hypothetical protein